jgi:hypothetical protein
MNAPEPEGIILSLANRDETTVAAARATRKNLIFVVVIDFSPI